MKVLLGIAIVAVVLCAGVVAYSYSDEVHGCTHPGMGTCPGSSTEQALHCEGCSHPEHAKGCKCVKNYPCGTQYDESAYCTPEPQY